jgi:hypothetical protein
VDIKYIDFLRDAKIGRAMFNALQCKLDAQEKTMTLYLPFKRIRAKRTPIEC